MDDRMVCFIVCSNDNLYTQECLYYINRLNVPEGYEIDVLTVEDAHSMTAGYNEAMSCSEAKYKVYLHQDVFIINPDFIQDCLNIFQSDAKIGMIGNVGVEKMPVSGIMWEGERFGKVYEQHNYETVLWFNDIKNGKSYMEVESIDGFLMVTQYDIPWREDLFDKWDFYDCSQSMEFIRRGYKVVVPKMDEPWCVHDCGFVSLGNYEEERRKFVEEYRSPLVSVIIPTYNRKHTLKRSIDSVLGQTYRNFEIILVDDCSTDGTMEYVEAEYGAISDINIVYVRNDSNLGAAGSRNAGVSYANGEYIAFHDSDDEWFSDKLEKQMLHFMECDSSVGAVYSMFYMNEKRQTVWPPKDADMSWKSGYVFHTLLISPLVGMITLVVRKNVFLEVGGFREQLNSLEDYELTIRIARKYAIELVDGVLAVAYESESSVGKRNKDKIATQCFVMDFYHDALALAGLKKRKFDAVYQEAGIYGCEEFFLECVRKLFKDEEYLAYAQEKWDIIHPSSHPEQILTCDISEVSACTGCMACHNVCPVEAVSQGYSEEGFLVPIIDYEKCTQCGRCKAACPVCNETQGMALPDECYAVMGSHEIRKQSSSGGVFRTLADEILDGGGYVAGAVWNDEWKVAHIVSDKPEDVGRMMSSKYVQSNIGDVYRQIKFMLDQGKKVLFTGCACQVVGLKRYLGGEYDNLLLADVVCHGVPSQQVFDAHPEKRENIAEISFRKKSVFGWGSGLYIKYRDGEEYIGYTAGDAEDPYMFGFLKNWTLRKSCFDCKFKNKKYSDLSLGDFWGINSLYQFDDGMGTSFVTLNTLKGALFLKGLIPKWEKILKLDTGSEEQFNPCISQSVKETKFRNIFFEEWKKRDGQTLTQVIQSTKDRVHFDVAIVCMWGINYGNAITNYALYTFLKAQGQKVLMLDNYCSLTPINQFKTFAKEHYVLSSEFFADYDYKTLNECCDTFVVGSDQTWNYAYAEYYRYGNYFLLDFVEDYKKKISYAASFGMMEATTPIEVGRKMYPRFQAISVREEFGIDLCRNPYGVDAKWVLDPVFLLDQEEYDALLCDTPIQEKEPYIAAYLLDPNKEKRNLCLQIQKELGGIKLVNIVDANLREPDYCLRVLEYDNIKSGLSVEEWLSYLRNAAYVITDSFHGTCFSIIFGKNFSTIKNRESTRFSTFTSIPELAGKVLGDNDQVSIKDLLNDIDYEAVNKRLAADITKSRQFIRENTLSGKE